MVSGVSSLNRTVRTYFKLILCFLIFLIYFLISLFVSLIFIFLKPNQERRFISRFIQWFASSLVRILNIRITISGEKTCTQIEKTGIFFVSNHLGYVDGLVLGATFPLIYVSKSELKNWPLIGPMTQFSGTLFIDRQRKNHIAEYIQDIARVLKQGVNILFFPEGTSTNGEVLLPFNSSFFEAPLKAGAPIAPISLIYKTVNGQPLSKKNRDFIYWYGEMTFLDHFFRLLSCDYIEIEVKVHAPIVLEETMKDRGLLRKHASEMAYRTIFKDIHLMAGT